MLKKITLIFCYSFITIIHTTLHAQQTIDLGLKDVSIEKAIKEIEKKTNYSFMFDNSLDLTEKITADYKNESVNSILNSLFQRRGITYDISGNRIILKKTTVSQNTQKSSISGIVSDINGDPLIGVNVVVKGTTNGVITDINGKYTISAGEKDVLIFSYTGYIQQEIVVGRNKTLNMTMQEDNILLDAVVVTALGIKRAEKAVGYAVTEIGGDEIRNANSVSPISALQGKVAGVQIAGSDGGMFGATKIHIRGASTLQGNNQPIYVVDGIILDNEVSGNSDLNWSQNASDYGNELKNLNPDDFESVSVLKGAAATALYGSRGLNGVVLITTKSGKNTKGLGISVSQTLGFDANTQYPKLQNDFGYGLFPGARGDFGNRWDPNSLYLNSDGQPSFRNAASGWAWGPRFDGRPMENYDGSMTTYSANEDRMREAYKTGFHSNTNITIKGGNEKASFYSSLSYLHKDGITENNKFERYSMLLKGTYQINDRFDVNASVNFAHSKPQNAAREVGWAIVYSDINPSDSPEAWKNKYKGPHGGIANTSFGDEYGYVPSGIRNLWWNMFENNTTQKEYSVRPTFEANYKIADWVTTRIDGNMNYYSRNQEDKTLGSGYQMEGGSYRLESLTKEQFTFGGSFILNKSLNDFNVGGFARFEYYNNTEQYMSASTSGGLIVPGKFFLANSKQTQSVTGRIQNTKRMLSGIFAANIAWKDQVYLDITGRNDWSSSLVYADGHGKYSYFYPSVSASWLFNETFKNVFPSWIDLTKVRLSWAQVGNDTSPYRINSGYNIGRIKTADGYIYTNAISGNTLVDQNLKPERKTSWEAGLDLRFLNSRLGFDFTYYKENTKDQIMTIAVPQVSGVDNKLINAGNIQNSGVELSLKTVPFRNKDWEWGLNFTYTKNTNKIVSLHPDVADYIALEGQVALYDYRIGSVARVGGKYGELMTDMLPRRDENGNILLAWNENYRAPYALRDEKISVVGDINPDFLGSLHTNLRWKNLYMGISLDCRYGGYIASLANRYGTQRGLTETSLKYRDKANGGIEFTSKWLNADGTHSDSYGMSYTDGVIIEGVFQQGTNILGLDGKRHDLSGMSFAEAVEKGILEPAHAGAHHHLVNDWGLGILGDNWFSKVNYIALREVSISYSFDRNIAKKLGLYGLGVSFSGRNLGYLYNSLPNKINPESVRGNRAGEFRIRSYSPNTASFMFTINMDF